MDVSLFPNLSFMLTSSALNENLKTELKFPMLDKLDARKHWDTETWQNALIFETKSSFFLDNWKEKTCEYRNGQLIQKWKSQSHVKYGNKKNTKISCNNNHSSPI